MARTKPMASGRFKLYNIWWEPMIDPVAIEAVMIRRGGRWKKTRSEEYAGEGLFFHFKRFISLVWPEHVWHRWNELELHAYLNNRVIGEMGPASSGKTHSAAIHVLADYYVWDDCTTVLVSSTEREMLEMRVWGEIKKLHRQAKERFADLVPGNLIESRLRIITDSRFENVEGRDFRNGICFPGETMVDTPAGPRRIDSIQAGDEVFNATGTGRVEETHCHITNELLIRVNLVDGRKIDCTQEHPFLTQRGWVRAVDLETFDMVFSADESLSLMQEGIAAWISKPEILQLGLSQFTSSAPMPSLRQDVCPMESKANLDGQDYGEILQSSLRGEMGWKKQQRNCQESEPPMPSLWHHDAWGSLQCSVLFHRLSASSGNCAMSAMWQGVPVNSGISSQTAQSILRTDLQAKSDRIQEFQTAGKSDPRGTVGVETFCGCLYDYGRGSVSHQYGAQNKTQPSTLVSNRRGFSSVQIGSGDRRRHPQDPGKSKEGQKERCHPKGTRVERIEVHKRPGKLRTSGCGRGYFVYNLSVSQHPSYSVNGVIVHNCGVPCKKGGSYVGLGSFAGIKNKRLRMVADECHLMNRVFVDAIANLNKNADFKCVALGNPKDITDALGIICEPAAHIGGWDGGIDQGPKTKTWPTRFNQGICVQLVGSDSPNLDGKLGIPLIDQKAIDADIAFYGKESIQFSMMDEGRMPRGQSSRRVLTRQMCLKHQAMEHAVWKNLEQTKIGFLDAAYGGVGGDRCVFGELEFGLDVNDRQIMELKETMIVPINVDLPDSPEDQIALFVKDQCEKRQVPPQNFGFDSTGRGRLMAAFARIWSPYVVPVEFGGKPSERQVTWLPSEQKLTCREYYSKFVTELWYSVALIVQSGQFRGMTEDVMAEGCMREWGFVGANKIEVEPKEKMKLKTGRSPDLFDALVSGVEVARQRGFVISMLVNKEVTQRDDGWKEVLRKRMETLEANHRLCYTI